MTPEHALQIQEGLRSRVRLSPLTSPPAAIAGADAAYDPDSKCLCAAVVVLTACSHEVLDKAFVVAPVTFPYIPGMLAFREGPALARAFFCLRHMPDLVFFDGYGTFHPRDLGLASHLGVLLDVPALGCAKTPFLERIPAPAWSRGSMTLVRSTETRQAACVRTKDGVKPLFVSPGHRITLEEAVRWVLETTGRYRIPEPLRRAHIAAKEELRRHLRGYGRAFQEEAARRESTLEAFSPSILRTASSGMPADRISSKYLDGAMSG
jgi:deoxyribonuclease V